MIVQHSRRPLFRVKTPTVAVPPIDALAFSGYGATTNTKGSRGSAFSPGGSPSVLWSRAPHLRRVDLSGLFSPEDTIIAVARGMAPGIMAAMEWRATIRGGLTALKMAGVKGYTRINVAGLKSTTANLPRHDTALIRAAGGGGNTLKRAGERIQRIVARHHLSQAAWGARQLYILANLAGFQIAHAVAAAAVNVIPAVGQIVSAAASAHMAISAAIAKKIAEEAGKNIKTGLARHFARKSRKAASASTAEIVAETEADEGFGAVDPVNPGPPKNLLLRGIIAVGLVLLVGKVAKEAM